MSGLPQEGPLTPERPVPFTSDDRRVLWAASDNPETDLAVAYHIRRYEATCQALEAELSRLKAEKAELPASLSLQVTKAQDAEIDESEDTPFASGFRRAIAVVKHILNAAARSQEPR